jgi:hypothetical protein
MPHRKQVIGCPHDQMHCSGWQFDPQSCALLFRVVTTGASQTAAVPTPRLLRSRRREIVEDREDLDLDPTWSSTGPPSDRTDEHVLR